VRMWEYTIREYVQEWGDPGEGRAAAAFLAELNELGRQGWEAVGLAPRTHYDRGGGPPGWDSFTFVVLMKREITPSADMPTDSPSEPASDQ
jgi:hypothetical protein